MMNLRYYAKKIPDEIRSKRLMVPGDPISNAKAVSGDKSMQLLFAIWYEFIEPASTGDMGCRICLRRVLVNFKEMKGELMQLEKEYNLLAALKK